MFYLDLIRGVGGLVTILGLVVVAPRAAYSFVSWPYRFVRRALRGQEPSRGATIQAEAARAHARFPASDISVSDSVEARILTPEELRIAKLEDQVAKLSAEMKDVRTAVSSLSEETKAELVAQRKQLSTVKGDAANLSTTIRKQQKRRELADTRGFPLAAFGAAVAALPGGWLVVDLPVVGIMEPTLFGWFVLCLSVVLGAVAMVWLVQRGGEQTR